MQAEETLKEYIKEEKLRKVFAKVFDEPTIMALHRTAKKGYFHEVEFVISTGKEANVFRAQDKAGNFRAVKIYKIKTSDFRNMEKYIQGDQRFKNERKTKKDIVFTWAKKEFKNLSLAKDSGASVPLPIFVHENILVMEFIGHEYAAPKLKDANPTEKDVQKYFEQTIDFIALIFFSNDLIHADLSEYNTLVKDNSLFFIDMGQSVLSTHPRAQEFFERDIENMATYFSKQGIDTNFNDMLEKIRAKKKDFQKKL